MSPGDPFAMLHDARDTVSIPETADFSSIVIVLESLMSSVNAVMSIHICLLITILAHIDTLNVCYYYSTHFHLISTSKRHFNTSTYLRDPFTFYTLLLLRALPFVH